MNEENKIRERIQKNLTKIKDKKVREKEIKDVEKEGKKQSPLTVN